MKFSEVIGQENAKSRIIRMIDNDEIPHALLIHGEPGIPKLALARAMAQYIHCENRQNGDSCGHCPSCMQHRSLNHADTYYSFPIVKKSGKSEENANSDDYSGEWKEFISENPIVENYEKWLAVLKNENAQPVIYKGESVNIIHKMSLSTLSTKYKVLIMWLPEKMNATCANRLLKLIEEPSNDSIFILVSDNCNAILPTIYSRTQRIELKRLPVDVIAEYLKEKYNLDGQEALAVAATADGNIIQAENNLAYNSESKDFFKEFVSLMRLAYSRDLKSLREWSERIFAYKREKIRRFLKYAARMVRENYIYNIKAPELNYLTQEEEAFSVKFAPFINEGNVIKMLEELTKAEIDIAGNANGKIVLFDLAIKITIFIKR
ncbi:MAG: DNA polymerase III subunit delta [Muribaculaceae bacterium]|nr:DNA polymerase III subunit delta [Muribaculaceae bacterium]